MSTNPGAGDSTPGAESQQHIPAEVEGRTLCVVVHGLGDPALGEAVREVARGLTTGDRPVEMIEETHWVPGPDRVEDDGRSVRAFPVPVLRDRDGDLVIAEVHWGDLSKFPVSLFGLVSGFFTVLFGLRYIAYQAVDTLDAPGAKVLRWLIRAATGVLIGPLAATSLLLLCLALGGVILNQFPEPLYAQTPVGDYVACLCVLAALALGVLLALRFRENQVIHLIGVCLCAVALGLLGDVGAGLAAHHLGSPRDEWGVFGQGIISYIRLAASLILPLFLVIGTLQVASLFAMWWLAARSTDRSQVTSAAVAASLPFVMTLTWSIVVPIGWVAVGATLLSPEAWHDFQRPFLDNPMLLPWLAVPLLLLLFVVVPAVLAQWRRRCRRPGPENDRARLIVNLWIQWGLVAVYITAASIILLEMAGLVAKPPIHRVLAAITASLGVVSIIVSQGFPRLRTALDLVYDVVNHFFFRFRNVDERGSEAEPPPFPVRRAIEDRLKATLDHFAERLVGGEGPPWGLIVLSHSQGTVLAIEALNDSDNEVDRFGDVRLVTMGSPFSHIYQHYFRHYYPSLSDDQWRTLRRRLASPDGGPPRWLNLFRIDDYVGRSIDESVPGMVANVPIGPRGHLGYWVDRDVLRHIESGIGFPSRGPGAGTASGA